MAWDEDQLMKKATKSMALGTGGVVVFCIGLATTVTWCVYYVWCAIEKTQPTYWPLIAAGICFACCLVIQVALSIIDKRWGRCKEAENGENAKPATKNKLESETPAPPIIDDTYIRGTPPYDRVIDTCDDDSCVHDWTLVSAIPLSMVAGTIDGLSHTSLEVTYRREFVCDLCGATMHDLKDVSQ